MHRSWALTDEAEAQPASVSVSCSSLLHYNHTPVSLLWLSLTLRNLVSQTVYEEEMEGTGEKTHVNLIGYGHSTSGLRWLMVVPVSRVAYSMMHVPATQEEPFPT